MGVEDMKKDRKLQTDDMNRLLCRLLWSQLHAFEWFKGIEINIDELKTRHEISDLYGGWLGETFDILARNNFLEGNGPIYIKKDPTPIDIGMEWQEWQRQISPFREDPDTKAQIHLIEAMLRGLPEILAGKIPATDIMFPNSSMELVEGIYINNPVADYFNEILANAVCAYLKFRCEKDPSARIRIMEIGAGTGGTSVMIFQKIKPYGEHIQEYCYTDISKAFLLHAEKKYRPDNPYLTYQIFDVEAPVSTQGIKVGEYDIAIAANVLHATKNIHRTLRNIKPVLKKNGLLLLNEISGHSLFSHLTFGLLEGWWRYEDAALRIPGSPALLPRTWQTVLKSEGFPSVLFPSQKAHDLGQQIIVAESDGVVRLPQLKQPRQGTTAQAKNISKTNTEPSARPKTLTMPNRGNNAEYLLEKATAYVKKLVGETLKIPSQKIDPATPLESYGIDSILVVELANKLGKTLKDINSTLFFEYQTIDALVQHLIQTQKDSLINLLGLTEGKLEEEFPGSEKTLTLRETPESLNRGSRRGALTRIPPLGDLETKTSRVREIAIIGLSGRYPGANNVNEYWRNLSEGRSCITQIPKERWDWREYYHEEKGRSGSIYTKWGGFITDVDKFDPLFFQISPKEAEGMDPQERLFIEEAYASIEDAGYTPATLCHSRRVGVFVGVMNAYYPTGASFWSAANRISYLMNFQGPSMAVDTACSSSLTAVHLALESLSNGTSDCALAGGVNLIIDPRHYLRLTGNRMLSAGNECKAFGDGADGIVDGEGVGAVILKPLTRAIADGDHIYGILKASMVNAGGKTNGYTVPNPAAQKEVIRAALEKSGVNARTISYLEAHGTGTSLGDPIEISGLTKAFQEYTQDKQFCAIGSVKPNIGHCESAAGIAGLTKVLLQLKNRQITPSLHSEVLNSNIDFPNTPFVVQQELTEWKRPVVTIDGVTREYPRIAGISSFGAGGSNAHIVIEEYNLESQEQTAITVTSQQPALIILSAKDEERLKEQAQRLLAEIREHQFSDADLVNSRFLADMAYTLQVGREAMEERLGVITGSIEELAGKLAAFLAGQSGIEDLYRGRVKGNQEALTVFTADEDLQKAVKSWVNKGKYAKLLDLWTKGMAFDWNKVHGEPKPHRVSLPTYPFAKERYWFPEMETRVSGKAESMNTIVLHPLLQQNNSDLWEQRYSSTFTGREFFLKDHVIMGQRVLPGVAYLEMARAAVASALNGIAFDADVTGSSEDCRAMIRLTNVVWIRPIGVGERPAQVHIGLYPEDGVFSEAGAFTEGGAFRKGDGEIAYEIYSLTNADEAGALPLRTVYSQGRAALVEDPAVPVLDLRAIRAECSQRNFSAAEVYDFYKALGVEYGPGHRGLEQVYTGQGRVIAKLSLPECVAETEEQYVLHPSIMDAALQASMGMIQTGDIDGIVTPKPSLPFALQELQIYHRCIRHMWAVIEYSKGDMASDKLRKLDIDLCDEQGEVAVRMKGFSARTLENGITEAGASLTHEGRAIKHIMLEPVWEEQPAPSPEGDSYAPKVPEYTRRLVFLCELGKFHTESIANELNGARVVPLQTRQKAIEERFTAYAARLCEEIREIFAAKPGGKVLVQVVVARQGERQLFAGLSGILKTAGLENPKVNGQLIELEGIEDLEGLIAKLQENSHTSAVSRPMDHRVRYQGGKRLVPGWNEVAAAPERTAVPWKDGGVYLITGGAGGLGRIFAKEIAAQVQGATLVLTGRSALGADKQGILGELERGGARAVYRQVDVTDKKAVNELIANIGGEFGRLDGIIHSAGIIRDNYILKKTSEELMEVLGPKVAGLINLDMATKNLNLDFMILSSSIAGSWGNPGQADYATANAFMDAYAAYRNALVSSGERHGKTLSINWPLWQEGGMRMDETTEKMMGQNTSMVALGTSTGIQALYDAVASGRDQVMVLAGDIRRIQAALSKQAVVSESETTDSSRRMGARAHEPVTVANPDQLSEKVSHYLKKLLAQVIKLPVEQIEADTPLEKYGIDSIMVMELTNQLEKTFGPLSKTLFFEYQTIGELSGYFLETYREQLMQLIEIGTREAITGNMGTMAVDEPVMPAIHSHKAAHPRRSRFSIQHSIQESKANKPMDIAIIGAAGRYPQAANLREFWQNLRDGKDCITEIPKDRWDHSLYYDEDKNKPGKTYSKWGGFIAGADQFDPLFFNISPREAEFMDPQERLFLECVYETLEDAGYTRQSIGEENLAKGQGANVGVYAGVMYEEYQLYGAQAQIQDRMIAIPGVSASIANRVSYFFNFHGPSMTVNTMCSSSLAAIHLACQSIRHGGCEAAIAGGVNVSIHPNKYLVLGEGKFASSKGRCESFGQGGDGYVPGEGVGAILLKPLSKAIADGDQIYGVIKGTAINHGGKTNGYSVPNPNAQAGAIGQAIQEAGVDPRTISYIETHGTGTSLGDPIEIAGLAKAFQKATEDKQFCAIGSVKSNIGHCESAAGIAGVTKVLMQIKNRQIVPSLHSETLNPNIDFIKTPFIVQQTLTEWERPVVTIEGVSKEYPRIAGISSFGAGGSNAHIIIEEYNLESQEQTAITVTPQQPALIILSAKDEERLKEQVARLIVAIREGCPTDTNLANSRFLADMAYTLQVGREAMEERLGVIAGSTGELTEKLAAFLAGQSGIEDLYHGRVKRNQDPLTVFTADEDLQNAVESWLSKGKYAKLLDLWTQGLVFDWNRVYGENKPRRISLPTYPFAKESYWIPESARAPLRVTGYSPLPTLHPLLHQNTSTLSEQRYSSTFSGEEFFLADHIVKGRKILPGVAQLEMARAAVERALGVRNETLMEIRLKNIVWVRPITVGEGPVQVHIGLFPEANGEIAYEIYSIPDNDDGDTVIHSQGSATWVAPTSVLALDLPAIQAQCNLKIISDAEVYDTFESLGIEYGPGQQGLEEIHIGPGQVLAKLSLPSAVSNTRDQFGLHPSIMDSALQASLGLAMPLADSNENNPSRLSFPFALQELEIKNNNHPAWAFIRASVSAKSADKLQKLDIDVCDGQGNVCVRMKGYSSRVLEGEADSVGIPEQVGTIMLHPDWKKQRITQETSAPEYAEQLIFLCEMEQVSSQESVPEDMATAMKGTARISRCLNLQSKQKGIDKRFQTYATKVFEEIQIILKDKPTGNVLIQIVAPNQGEAQLCSGLAGLLKTARLENPRISGQVIEVDPTEDIFGLIAKLKENSRAPFDNQIWYQNNTRYIINWTKVEAPKAETETLWKDRGVYLITGGAGGLGLLFAKEIAQKAKDVTLILTGRSTLSDRKQARLKELKAIGAGVEYKQVDVTDQKEVTNVVEAIVKEFGGLHGVIHSAGIIRDNYIIKKTKEEFSEVLAPKVNGLVNLDEATKDQPLDFFITFSSMAGALGNEGQADYATANAFMDVYAKHRNLLVASNRRHGRTLTINWSLWQEGGMSIDKEAAKMMKQTMGMIPMQTRTGIQALYQAFDTGKGQLMVAEGYLKRLQTGLAELTLPKEAVNILASGTQTGSANEEDGLEEKAVHFFKKLLSALIKLPLHKIDADAPMEQYGIDSVMVMQMTNQLETIFGSLSKTLFFEYQTIRKLAGFFLESYRSQLVHHLGIESKAAVTSDDNLFVQPKPYPIRINSHRSRFAGFGPAYQGRRNSGALDIAIIGVSGRYPQARNLQEFWQNLRDGRDCITEIPKERWDYNLYFDEDKNKPGKTYTKWGGFLEGADQFDPLFFNISPREAEGMDPQERLFLECVYETLEDAGYTREALSKYQSLGLEGNVGVFVGVMYEEYQLYGAQEQIQGRMIALSGNPSSIANRVSYFCNFHGPSVAIDTMCSSSLMAIHLACQSLQRGGCELAIAGGVNVSIHPNKYLALGQGKFASSKGRCESFGEGGDGYVPGEGVGAVLLKSLSRAISDGDQIYGIIKGTAVNHGGKTNGYTVPNPNAQASVIGQAIKEAGINPRAISYIEAHGTGTSLGDPIEITGLTKAFREYTGDNQYCAIGSAKSNIGHCESAAGIAGVTKVLLQLKHRQLVPSLHSQTLNPNIDFNQTPFVVQRDLAEWKQPIIPESGESKEYPRIAGISAFGAGGSNAHIVIEEYISKEPAVPENTLSLVQPFIILLSAKNEERLKEKARQLLAAIQERQFSDTDLADIAYTLQIGREAMEERLGFAVNTIPELVRKLEEFVTGGEDAVDLFRGNAGGDKETLTVLAGDEEISKAIDTWIDKRKYEKLVNMWTKGLAIDWRRLYSGRTPRRISLPTYPFARESYWVPVIDTDQNNTTAGMGAIHPLLHRNTSNFFEQRFSSTFTGREAFLREYAIKSRPIFPPMVHLEMAQVAVLQSAEIFEDEHIGFQLKNIIWNQPIVLKDQPFQVHIGLYPETNHKIDYEIFSSGEENDPAQTVVYNKGTAILTPVTQFPTLDLAKIKAECNQKNIHSQELYQALNEAGNVYGPGYQAIQEIYVNQDRMVVKLSAAYAGGKSVSDTEAGARASELWQSLWMMEAVLQAISALSACSHPAVPLALREFEVYGKPKSTMWVLIRTENDQPADLRIFNIDICDESGAIWLRMNGLELSDFSGIDDIGSLAVNPQKELMANTSEAHELMTFEEAWQEQPLADDAKPCRKTYVCFLSNPENQQTVMEVLSALEKETTVIFISQGSAFEKITKAKYTVVKTDRRSYDKVFQGIADDYGQIDAILYLWPFEDSSCLKEYSGMVFMLQGVKAAKLTVDRIQLAAQYQNELERCYIESWIGFERTLRLTIPKMQVAVIYQPNSGQNDANAMRDWIGRLWRELQTPKSQNVFYHEGKRQVCLIRPTTISPVKQLDNHLLKPGGTYLITGGCGGLGILFAKHFANKINARGRDIKPVNLIITGRSPIDAEKQLKIKALEDLGSRVIYVQADASDPVAMKTGLSQAKESFGNINGVVHAAGIAGATMIFDNDISEFAKVLAPKIKGTLLLDELLKTEPLDFICYFSSTSAILGDFGSCDYAVANRFLISYAHYRNQRQSAGECQGKSVVINWPVWKDGGMTFGDARSTELYLKSSGQRFLETEEGLDIFDRIMVQSPFQHIVMAGQPSQIHRILALTNDQTVTPSNTFRGSQTPKRGWRPEMKGLSIKQCLEWDLKGFINRLLKISRDKIDLDKNLADFGFNSIGLTQLALQLVKQYGIDEITPALFFMFPTIDKLVQYFVTQHQAVIEEFYREELNPTEPVEPTDLSLAPKPSIVSKLKRQEGRKLTPRFLGRDMPSSSILEPIAIIGMSGRFPGARNIDELWTILVNGQDMVGEIPKERFDWRQYYGDPTEPGKTNCKWCGCIPGVSEFEPLFFEISPKEAETMDPRQRLLLQEAWRALEDAGYGLEQIKREKIGMFVGVEQGDYQFLTQGEGEVTANSNSILAARLAYFLNLSGPVMAIDTACSSGLVAAYQAVLSIRAGECDTAIAAGVNLLLTPTAFIGMSQSGMLSEDGKCFTFDKRANGLVPGEAVAIVVLKRLSRAEADGDPIYAVIKGSGINYDGKTNGITAPSGVSQAALLKEVYERNHINPEEIEYIIPHGTGTKLGDPVEINALYDAFKDYSRPGAPKVGYCALTSTKTNFGHTFAPSGLVSLISMVQALRHEIIPASLHCEQENDYINWKESPFYINKTNKPWPGAARGAFRDGSAFSEDAAISADRVRMGAVSAFGMSGTNVHMVVQSYCNPKTYFGEKAPFYLLAFSTKTDEALLEKAQDMIKVLEKETNIDLSQLSYTLLQGRQHFKHRCAIVIQDREDAIHVLKQIASKEKIPNLFQEKVPLDFTGQKAIAEYAQDLLKQSQTLKGNRSKYQEMLLALADLYCQGYELEWNKLFGDIKPKRIHLPTYPFARERYWVGRNETETVSGLATPEATRQTDESLDEIFFEQMLDEVITGRTDTAAAASKTRQQLQYPVKEHKK